MKLYKSIIDTIGNTPLVELSNLKKKYDFKARIIAKVERFNPGGSVEGIYLQQCFKNNIIDNKK
ncbi:MAG: hypothetical protein J6X50_02950 [Bacilli bacterium]|nr:hypothetical protein [Bacilli bacterium]